MATVHSDAAAARPMFSRCRARARARSPRGFFRRRCCCCCVSLDFLFWSLRVNFLFDFQSIRNPSAIFVFFSLTILYLFCVLSVCEL
jgi:hypothetical protein